MTQTDQTASPQKRACPLARLGQIRNGWLIALISWCFASLATLLLLGAIHYGVMGNLHFYSSINHHALVLNAAIFFTVLTLLHAATNRWLFSAALLTLASSFMGLIHIVKLKALDTPLLPEDALHLSTFLKTVPRMMSGRPGALMLLVLLILLLLPVGYWALRRGWFKASRRYRLAALAGGILLALGIISFENHLKEPTAAERRIQWIDWSQKENYERNGFFVAYTTNFLFITDPIVAPRDYSATKIDTIYRKYLNLPADSAATTATAEAASTSSTLPALAPGEKANVIIYLADSFWDVSRLGIQTTADPIPFFHQLQKTALAGQVRTPTYIDYPARTEFEILTGISLDFLPDMTNPYSAYLDLSRPLPTLPRTLVANHYRTVAIHPYAREMWDRAKAFPALGFQEFMDIDAFKNARRAGPFISDEALVDKIIEVSRQVDPYFVFGVTISTHGPYDAYRDYLKAPLEVTTPLSRPAHDQVKTYINALARADAALRRLIGHFSAEKDKTLIVILGNHMPPLGEKMSIYRETHYLKTTDIPADKMLETPAVIWANYKLPPVQINRETYQLLPAVLRLAGVQGGKYEQFIEKTMQASAKERTNAPSQVVEDIQAVQYDLLFGQQYALGLEAASRSEAASPARTASLRPSFVIKAYGPKQVVSGESFNPQPDGSSAFWFQMATPVTSGTRATLNGLLLPTILNADRTGVSALLNKGHHLAPDTYRIYLYDATTGKRSNEVTFKVDPSGVNFTPTPTPRPTPTPPPGLPVITNWGPKVAPAGKTFNEQPGGYSALWFTLAQPVPRPVVIFNGTPLSTSAAAGGMVSALLPKNLLEKVGDFPIFVRDSATGKTSLGVVFRVYPRDAPTPQPAVATPAPPPDSSQVTVKNWGPQSTAEGTPFNAQAGGNSALWFILEHPATKVTVVFNGTPLATFVAPDGSISATVPKKWYEKSGDYPIVIKDNSTGKQSTPVHFVVSKK